MLQIRVSAGSRIPYLLSRSTPVTPKPFHPVSSARGNQRAGYTSHVQPDYAVFQLSFALCMLIAIVVPFVLTVAIGKKKGVA